MVKAPARPQGKLRRCDSGGMVPAMKILVSFAALLVLAACATTAPPATSVTAPQDQPNAAPSRTLALLRAAGAANAPTQAEIERLLGAPDIARQDGAGAALTYRYQQCALLLLFTADARNAMRLAQAHPGPRVTGAAEPNLAQCAAEADARGA